MKIPYEILLRGNNGNFQGAHALDEPDSLPRPVATEDWPEIVGAINTTAVARVSELEGQLAAQEEAATAREKAIVADVEGNYSTELAAVNADKAAALAQLESLKSAQAELIKRAVTTATHPDLSSEEKLQQLGRVIADAQKPELERKREALTAEIAAKQSELENLNQEPQQSQ